MAKNKQRIISVYRTAGRSELALIIPPILMYAGIVWALGYLRRELEASGTDASFMDWRWYAIPAAVLLLLPLWGKFKAFSFQRFSVTADAVIEERGFFSRRSSEIRIRDIRNITVQRSFLDRLLGLGDVSFSSSAGDGEEVAFTRVARPAAIRELVREIQELEKDGKLSDADFRRLRGDAPPPSETDDTSGGGAAGESSDQPRRLETSAAAVASTMSQTPGAGATPREPASVAAKKPAPRSAKAASDTSSKPSGDGDARDELYRLLAEQEADGKADA